MFINLVFVHLYLAKLDYYAQHSKLMHIVRYKKSFGCLCISLYIFCNSLKFGMQLNPTFVTLPNRRIVGSVDSGPTSTTPDFPNGVHSIYTILVKWTTSCFYISDIPLLFMDITSACSVTPRFLEEGRNIRFLVLKSHVLLKWYLYCIWT